MTETTSARLTELEGNLSNRSIDEREEISVAQSQAEREEDVLRFSLERIRSWKWSKLNDERPPARCGFSRSGPCRHRVNSMPYSQRAPRGVVLPVPRPRSRRVLLLAHSLPHTTPKIDVVATLMDATSSPSCLSVPLSRMLPLLPSHPPLSRSMQVCTARSGDRV